MSGTNAAVVFRGATLQDIIEAIGIPQFLPDGTGMTWIINGVIIQANISPSVAGASLSAEIPFNAGFTKQVLLLLAVPIGTSAAAGGCEVSVTNLNTFKIANKAAGAKTFYWLALGV